jgi:acyl-[acyl carrier protein]--UDP-N-acetylglucosamine O-acyltransferase
VVIPDAVLGAPPQNFKHKGGRTTLTIGRDCVIREAVTMHVGSDTDRGATTDRRWLLLHAIFEGEAGFAANLAQAAETYADFEPAMQIVEFLSVRGKRQFTLPGRGGGQDDADAADH